MRKRLIKQQKKEEHLLLCRRLAKLISRANKIIVVSHANPDGDAYGSSLGLGLALKRLRKKVVILNETATTAKFSELPGINLISHFLPAKLTSYDLIVFVDCGDLARAGDSFASALKGVAPSINIDHHQDNALFADHNFVSSKRSSASELVLDLLRELEKVSRKKLIDKKIATLLALGILSDTGCFRYSLVSAATFEAAIFLLQRGISFSDVFEKYLAKRSLAEIQLKGFLMQKVQALFDGQAAMVTITPEILAGFNCSAADCEGMAEAVRDIEKVKISACLRLENEAIKVSLRSIDGRYDVAKIAKCFAGGGHKCSSGFRFKGSEQELKGELLRLIETALYCKKG